MSRKKGQLLSEISQNLKQTIKQYNELTMDDNFFNDEFKSKSTNNYNNKQPLSSNSSNNNYNNKQITYSMSSNNYNNNNQINEDKNNNNDKMTLLKINEMDEEMSNIEQHQSNFVSQLNTLMNNLNILEDNINKDFDELENYIENDIEKELISKQ